MDAWDSDANNSSAENPIISINSSIEEPVSLSSLVKPEEAVIVGFILIAWVGVILLFIRKWGKIRGLEPYTPAFERTLTSTLPISKQVASRNSSLIHELNLNIRRKSTAMSEGNGRRLSSRINMEGSSLDPVPSTSLPHPHPLSSSSEHKPLLVTQSCAILTTK